MGEKEVDEVLDFVLDEDNVKGRGISKSNSQLDGRGDYLRRTEWNDTCGIVNERADNVGEDDEYHSDDLMDIDASMYSDSENSMEDEMGRLGVITENLRQDLESQHHGSMMHVLGQLVSDDEGSVASKCSSPFVVEHSSANDIISREKNVCRKSNKKRRTRRIVRNKLKSTNAKKESMSSRRKARNNDKKNKKAKEETQVLQGVQDQSSMIKASSFAKMGELDALTIFLNILLWLAVPRFMLHSNDSLMNSEGMPKYCIVRRDGGNFLC